MFDGPRADSDCFVCNRETTVRRADLVKGSILGASAILDGLGAGLRGKSVVLATRDQLTTGVALYELEGLVRRLAIYSNELSLDHLPQVIAATEADVVVSDRIDLPNRIGAVRLIHPNVGRLAPQEYERGPELQTEWVMFTSGTMGPPKLVAHTLKSLIGAIGPSTPGANPPVWGTFYDIRRFGGLQVFLRAALAGASLVLTSPEETPAEFLERAGALGVTHISGTPSQWRRALMCGAAGTIRPQYVRMSGEIADQTLLNRVREMYPAARIVHAFGSSEAGTVFEVSDGLEGFPAETLAARRGVEMKLENETLRVRSGRTASRYLGVNAPALKDDAGWVDTGDVVEMRNGRYYFAGRRDGRINVGGLKVHTEEVEAVINRHPDVQMSLVRAKKSAVTGAVVIADVVLKPEWERQNRWSDRKIVDEILQGCRQNLPAHKVPVVIHVVERLEIADSGKIVRGESGDSIGDSIGDSPGDAGVQVAEQYVAQ
jgi:acyl-CoA synthetase (AMP-forming)/AMP-acid ligase II